MALAAVAEFCGTCWACKAGAASDKIAAASAETLDGALIEVSDMSGSPLYRFVASLHEADWRREAALEQSLPPAGSIKLMQSVKYHSNFSGCSQRYRDIA